MATGLINSKSYNTSSEDAVLSSKFVNYYDDGLSSVRFVKTDDVVYLAGLIKTTAKLAASAETTIFTLPQGYRPACDTAVIGSVSSYIWLCRVYADGRVTASRYRRGTSNSAISSGAWLVFYISFIAQ